MTQTQREQFASDAAIRMDVARQLRTIENAIVNNVFPTWFLVSFARAVGPTFRAALHIIETKARTPLENPYNARYVNIRRSENDGTEENNPEAPAQA